MSTDTVDRPQAETSPATVEKHPAVKATPQTPTGPVVAPRADVWETAEAAHLAVELPGVAPDGLDLQIENDRLTLTATAKNHEQKGRLLAAEWHPRRYQRTFVLSEDADRGAVDAHLRHGLLLVTIPRRAESRPRSIQVRVAAD